MKIGTAPKITVGAIGIIALLFSGVHQIILPKFFDTQHTASSVQIEAPSEDLAETEANPEGKNRQTRHQISDQDMEQIKNFFAQFDVEDMHSDPVQLVEEIFSPEEAEEPTAQEESNPIKTLSEESEASDTKEGGVGETVSLTALLYQLVVETCELEDILNEYGVFLDDGGGSGYCPFCSEQTFSTMINGQTGRHEFWCCGTCTIMSSDIVGFVSRIEGIGISEAIEFLAEREGLLK